MARCFVPTLITTTSWEGFRFVGHEIRITEAVESYGAVVWPSVSFHLEFATFQGFFSQFCSFLCTIWKEKKIGSIVLVYDLKQH